MERYPSLQGSRPHAVHAGASRPLSTVLVVQKVPRSPALERALRLPLAPGARLTVLASGGPPAHARLRKMKRITEGRAQFDLQPLAAEKPDQLAREARLRGAELLVVSQNGSGLWARFRRSEVERLACSADFPVLYAKRRPARPYRRAVFATDFSDASAQALRFTRALLPAECELTLLHAYDTSYLLVLRNATATIEQQVEFEHHVRARAEAQMQAFLDRVKDTVLVTQTVVLSGDPHEELHAFADQHLADLIIVGRTSGGRKQAQTRTVAGVNLHRAPCDVLVIPHPPQRVH